ncbi:MAG TPA: hypothetical protein VIL07_05325 [Symbiobacteriaceae bacterium]
MRRGIRPTQLKLNTRRSTMSRDLDWLVDQWNDSPADVKLQLVLAKIRAEESMEENQSRRTG